MGMADIVPGVSGGTVALITGVYHKLIESISSFNKAFFSKLLKREFRLAFNQINLSFLLTLFLGIILAVISMSRVMHFFMDEFAILTWSLFFGLILASIIFIGKTVENIFAFRNLGLVLIGAIIGYSIVSLIPVTTPNSILMIFLSGCIAICAMILPGISGSFILLILGKYLYITSALKNPFNPGSIAIIGIFSFGCLLGLLSFSKVLNFLLKSYHNITMCILTGFMIGSIKKIWPWKEVLEAKIIRGKTHVLREMNILPPELNTEVIMAFSLMIIGIVLVLVLERINKK
jgi:putative membrane protein